MKSYISEYNRKLHIVLKSLVEQSCIYDKNIPFGVCDNTKLFCQSLMNEFENQCLTPTGRYSQKNLGLQSISDQHSIWLLADILESYGYFIEGVDEFTR